MRWTRVVASIALVAIFLVSSYGLSGATAAPAAKSKMAQFDQKISHIVFLMQENHAFDSIFGNYCPTFGTYCSSIAAGVPPGTCVARDPANPLKGCVRPFNFSASQVSIPDMAHDWWSTHTAWDSGAMDGFLNAEGSTNTFGHYNASTAPLYYDLAEQYGLGDNFFSGSQSYSLAQHWYMFASMPPPTSQVSYIGWSTTTDHQYLNESNTTKSFESSLLNNTNVSWKYYDYGLPPWYNRSIGGGSPLPAVALDYWNPLAARAQSYLPHIRNHFVSRSTFFTDAANGSLPDVSWVQPTATDSDHPSFSLVTGQNWVASVVDAVEKSPEWNSTALFITWDEYGGFYDHVPPPYQDQYGAGFRVPLIGISPWIKQGYVDHTQMSFDSILHLMEKRFGFACIGPRDCNARVPLGMFDFGMSSPRYPIGFPTNGTALYPMPLQSGGTLPYYSPHHAFKPSVHEDGLVGYKD